MAEEPSKPEADSSGAGDKILALAKQNRRATVLLTGAAIAVLVGFGALWSFLDRKVADVEENVTLATALEALDQGDYGLLQRCLSGPTLLMVPNCAN